MVTKRLQGMRIYLIALAFCVGACGDASNGVIYHVQRTATMEPTIEVGETVRFNRFSENANMNIERYSLILYENTDNTYPNFIAISRVVGLPGEVIEIFENSIAIDGETLILPDQLEEIYSEVEMSLAGFEETEHSESIGEDEFFVIGDNHDSVVDSRLTGPIPFSSIKGYASSGFNENVQEGE